MLYSSSLFATLVVLPSLLAQNTSTSTGAAGGDSAQAAPAAATASSGNGTPFTPATVTGTSCGSSQQNFNQCITKVGKDISNCGSSDNLCLCQTYANIAACYNACAELADQGTQYKAQSTQYCTAAGTKVNTTTTTTSPNSSTTTNSTSTTTPASSTSTNNTVPISSTSSASGKTNTTSPSTASTFSASKSGASHVAGVSLGFATAATAVVFALFA